MFFSVFQRASLVSVLVSVCMIGNVGSATAATAVSHPEFIHGLRDLGVAHKLLEQSGRSNIHTQETLALRDIDTANMYATRVAEANHENIHQSVPADAMLQGSDPLVRAISALNAARHDFSPTESGTVASGLQRQTLKYLDNAIGHAENALHDESMDKGR